MTLSVKISLNCQISFSVSISASSFFLCLFSPFFLLFTRRVYFWFVSFRLLLPSAHQSVACLALLTAVVEPEEPDRTGSRRQFPLDAFVIGHDLVVPTGVAVDQHQCIASQDVCSEKDVPISCGASVLKSFLCVCQTWAVFGLWSREHTLRKKEKKERKKREKKNQVV